MTAHINPFQSLTALVLAHKLWLPRSGTPWRLVKEPCVGGICGIDKRFRGLAVATDGIMVALLTSAGAVEFGHLDWFVKDPSSQRRTDLWDNAHSAKPKEPTALDELECLFV